MATAAQTKESDLIARISAARGKPEPEQSEPTENLEAVEVSVETPVEEVEEVEAETAEAEEVEEVTDAAPNAEESDGENVEPVEDEEELYVEYKGREINLKDIEEWEKGNLRQSDYTRKTQELADSRKAFEAERESFNDQQAKLTEMFATLEAMTQEDTLTTEQIAELREYEPEEYIKYQEKQAKRQELLKEAKKAQPIDNVDVAAESRKLFENHPDWVSDGKTTEAFTNDTALMKQYALDAGYSDEEFAGLNRAHHMQTILDAAKFRQMNTKNAALEKKVRKAPVATKPRSGAAPTIRTQLDKAKARLKQTGSVEDAMAVKKLQRQL
jgi:hypothetical protein